MLISRDLGNPVCGQRVILGAGENRMGKQTQQSNHVLRSQIQSGRAGIDSHNANKNVGERWIEQRVPSQ